MVQVVSVIEEDLRPVS